MISTVRYDCGNAFLNFRKIENGWELSDCSGMCEGQLFVPGDVEGEPVVRIAKKAFLGKKRLRKVTLPSSIREIGDWAFAYCSALTEVVLPVSHLGQTVFLGCDALEKLVMHENEQIQNLLSLVAPTKEGEYLLRAEDIGSRDWLLRYDAYLEMLFGRADNENFQNQILCGEEDYGSTDVAAYESKMRCRKIKLLAGRILNNLGLSTDLEKKWKQYLIAHTAASGVGEEFWLLLLSDWSTQEKYWELFWELGCVTQDNKEYILKSLGDRLPERKAFLLKKLQENAQEVKSVFEALAL